MRIALQYIIDHNILDFYQITNTSYELKPPIF